MPLHRFFVRPNAISGRHAAIDGEQARQIATVLRLAPDQRVVLLLDGIEHTVRLERVAPERVEGLIEEARAATNEPRVRVTLALPILRGDRSEEAVEAVTQLGVSRIVPFISERSVARDLSAPKRRRWERIAREAAETARRGRVPEVAEVTEWATLFDVLGLPTVVAWEEEDGTALRSALPLEEAVSLVVGPEGGLSPAEIDVARSRGSVIVSLGPRTLRSETAATTLVAQAMLLLEERP